MNDSRSPLPCKDFPALLPEFIAAIRPTIDFWMQPLADEFQSEYPPASAQRLQALTGFTGSAGLAIFRTDGKKHALFIDGRYTLQAAHEINDSQFECINVSDTTPAEWLVENAHANAKIGFDPWITTHRQLARWQEAPFKTKVDWLAISPNPLDALWAARSPVVCGEVTLHPLEYAGVSYIEKREAILRILEDSAADACLLTAPDGINWLLNIRGADIPYNPLLLCYYVLRRDGSATLYTHARTFTDEVRVYLQQANITHASLNEIWHAGAPLFANNTAVLIDPAVSAHGFWQRAGQEHWRILPREDPTALAKACKNPGEQAAMVHAHREDGRAVSKFLAWFDCALEHGERLDELHIIEKLEYFRKQNFAYLGGSFPTIAGAGPNGAIVHYRATAKTNRTLNVGELLLLDSGGQYLGGTTDITRTVFVSPPISGSREKKQAHRPSAIVCEHVTRVLKGHIALARAVFPPGTTGAQLDALARQYLWEVGLDYDHGTGHGVGAYLCVHEGPQRISKRGSEVALREGMILSNEPGYYREGQYGIRIENLVLVCKAKDPALQACGYLAFETITLAPIDVRLLDIALLTAEERNWLNAYHRSVYKAHAPHMNAEELLWLTQATRAV